MSRILSGTSGEELLYVSDDYNDDVYVFALPAGGLVGTLTGFKTPQSPCADEAGDVFIPDDGASDIVEYAHGGSKPIKTLADTVALAGAPSIPRPEIWPDNT